MSLGGNRHYVEVTNHLELLVSFGMSFEGVVMSFIHNFT
jgi:hypothetical protein